MRKTLPIVYIVVGGVLSSHGSPRLHEADLIGVATNTPVIDDRHLDSD